MRLWMDRHCWMWFMVSLGMVLHSAAANYRNYLDVLKDLLPADYMLKMPESRDCVDQEKPCLNIIEGLCCFYKREENKTCRTNLSLACCTGVTSCGYADYLQKNIKGLLEEIWGKSDNFQPCNCSVIKHSRNFSVQEFQRIYNECRGQPQNCSVSSAVTTSKPTEGSAPSASSPASSKPVANSTLTTWQTQNSTVMLTASPVSASYATLVGLNLMLTAVIIFLVLLVRYLYLENRRLKRPMKEAEIYLDNTQATLQSSPETDM